MPLSEEEQRILSEIERRFYASDPKTAHQLSTTTLYRHAGRNCKWAAAGFVAPGSVTRGEFGLFRWEMAPNAGGPDPHIHRTFSESFYVLHGRVGLFDGSGWIEAGAGDFLYVPKHGIHAF